MVRCYSEMCLLEYYIPPRLVKTYHDATEKQNQLDLLANYLCRTLPDYSILYVGLPMSTGSITLLGISLLYLIFCTLCNFLDIHRPLSALHVLGEHLSSLDCEGHLYFQRCMCCLIQTSSSCLMNTQPGLWVIQCINEVIPSQKI